MRIGIAKYLAPIIFVYNPSLLFEGPLWMKALTTMSVLAGLWGLSLALEGYFRGPITLPLRVVLGVLSLGLLWPPGHVVFDLMPGYAVLAAGGLGIGAFALTRLNTSRQVAI